jgi:translocation and assembly module TamB
VHWSPFSLIKGKIFIREFSVQHIRLDRIPELSREIDNPSKSKLPSWPAALPGLRVDRLLIQRFDLGQAVLGENAAFKMEAAIRAESPPGPQETRILIERLDGPDMTLQFHAAFQDQGAVLLLDGSLAEARNGLIAAALGSAGPLSLSLRGKGPVQNWKGDFRADFPSVGRCESQIRMDIGRPFTLDAQGYLTLVQDFLPEPVAPWVGRDMPFSVSGRFSRGDFLDLERLWVQTDELELDVAGFLDLKKAHSSAQFTLLCSDIKPLSTWINGPSSGRLKAQGRISGPIHQPEAEIQFNARDVRLSKLSFANLDGRFLLQCMEMLTTALPKAHLKGEGMVKGLTLEGSKFPGQKQVQWQLEAENSKDGVVLIKKGKAEAEGIHASLTGRVQLPEIRGETDARLEVAETSVLAGIFGLKLPETGRTSLHGSLKGNLENGFLGSQFRGKSTISDQRVGGILGDELEYRGHLALDKEQIVLSDLYAQSSAGTLSGRGVYDLGSKTVKAASWIMEVPKLGRLSPVFNYPADGSLRMRGALEGPLSQARVSAEALCRDLRLGAVRLGETKATMSAHGLFPQSQGHFSIKVRPKGQVIAAEASFALQDEKLDLKEMLLEGAGAELKGTAVFDVSEMRSKGRFTVRSANLSVFTALFDKKAEGRAKGKVRFHFGRSHQEINLELEGQTLETPFVEAQQASLQAHIQEWFKSPHGWATLDIKDARISELYLSSSKLRAEGGLHQLAFTASARGSRKEMFELEGSGLFAWSPHEEKVTLSALKAQYGELPLILSEPVRIVHSKTVVAISPFALRIGSGVLKGKGTLGKNALSLELAFRDVSLEETRHFGLAPLRGTAQGNLLLQGPPWSPAGRLTLNVDDLESNSPRLAGLPPGSLQINAELNHGRIRGDLQLLRLTTEPFKAIVDVPLNLSVLPFACSVPPKEKISGHLDGEVDLARMVSFFGLDDQKMTGLTDLDLSLAGEVKEPQMKGRVILKNGTYENLQSGTILEDLDVQVAASFPRLTIERARATDGEEGTLTAQGWLDLLPSQGYPLHLDFTLQNAKPFRRDAASVTAEGQLSLQGSLTEPTLKGELLIASAEFRIPERLPPEVTNLKVIEINREGEIITPTRESSSMKSKAVKLDLSVGSSDRFFVRGRGLDSEWKGELKIKGTAADPVITGSLGLVRGRFNFLGKRFDLTRGAISFSGKSPPSPFLDVLGEARSRDITARIQLSGRFPSPDLQLSSDPPFPRDEILSRLLFGRSVTQITPLQAIQLANAVNTLAGGGGLDFMGKTREVLKLDRLELKQSGEAVQGAAVSAGKYISETVYLEVEQGLGPDSGKASVQWEVTPNITVETEAGVNAEAGAGISWKWDY